MSKKRPLCFSTKQPLEEGEGICLFVEKGLLAFGFKPPRALRPSQIPPHVWVACRPDVVAAVCAPSVLKEILGEYEVPPTLQDGIQGALHQRCLSSLGLMRKAGLVILGGGKIETFCRTKKGVARTLGLVSATQASVRECQQLLGGFPPGSYCVWLFSQSEMEYALGVEGVTYVGFIRHRLCHLFLKLCHQFSLFLGETSRTSFKNMLQESKNL